MYIYTYYNIYTYIHIHISQTLTDAKFNVESDGMVYLTSKCLYHTYICEKRSTKFSREDCCFSFFLPHVLLSLGFPNLALSRATAL